MYTIYRHIDFLFIIIKIFIVCHFIICFHISLPIYRYVYVRDDTIRIIFDFKINNVIKLYFYNKIALFLIHGSVVCQSDFEMSN